MQLWERFVLGRVGLGFAVLATLAIPIVGIVILRFLLSGVPVELSPGGVVDAVITARPAEQTSPRLGASRLPTVLPAATAPPASTQAAPQAPAVRASPTPTAQPVGLVNATDGLNLRTQPNTHARVLRILPFETEVKLTGRERLAEGLRWVELEQGGWVQERYLNR